VSAGSLRQVLRLARGGVFGWPRGVGKRVLRKISPRGSSFLDPSSVKGGDEWFATRSPRIAPPFENRFLFGIVMGDFSL